MALTWEEEDFYRTYKPMEGIMTATVLGGFFVFVCLLVLYKTQVKPMWKNRDGRRTGPTGRASIYDVCIRGGEGVMEKRT